jgi:hypothetical protein
VTEMTNNDLVQQLTAGLRSMASFIEQNPELAKGFRYTLQTAALNLHMQHDRDPVAQLAEYAKAAARHGATVTKDIDDQFHNLIIDFGGAKTRVIAYRNEVCERVVTGAQTVTKTVQDPDALAAVPTVEVTETVETYEWVCKPLLAADTAQVPA